MNSELTQKEKDLLRAIVQDKFSIGAFSGMIYNSVKDKDFWTDEQIDINVKLALQIRLRLLELTE